MRPAILLTFILGTCPAVADSAAATGDVSRNQARGITVARTSPNAVRIDVDWMEAQQGGTLKRKGAVRINGDDSVTVRSTNFNFIHYSIELGVEEKAVAAYQALEKLWAELLGMGPLLSKGYRLTSKDRPDPFRESAGEWLGLVENSRGFLADRSRGPAAFADKIAIDATSAAGRSRIEAIVTAASDQRTELAKRRGAVFELLLQDMTSANYSLFQELDALHQKVISGLDRVIQGGRLTLSGDEQVVGQKPLGHVVTVRLTPRGTSNDKPSVPVSMSYFVHSPLPVTFHTGYSYSTLDKVEFEKVSGLNGPDLFQKIQGPSHDDALAAFVSVDLLSFGNGREAIGLTLGTDLADPGKKIYVGGTARVRDRFFLTAGAASAEQTKEDRPAAEAIARAFGGRQLFETVVQRRAWSFFIAASVSPF